LLSQWSSTHAELEERTEQRHLLHHDLAGAQKRDRVRAVLLLDAFEILP